MKTIDFQKYLSEKPFETLRESIINATVLDDSTLKTILAGIVDMNLQMLQIHNKTLGALNSMNSTSSNMIEKIKSLEARIEILEQ